MGCSAAKRIDAVEPVTMERCKFHHIYSLGRLLGSGAFGTVFLASRQDSEGQWAVKVVNIADRAVAKDSSSRAIEEFRREHTAWARIGQHPNVVSLLEWHMDDKFGYLVMELCQGSLLQAWRAEKELNEYTYARYFVDMVMALRHIHSLGFVHRDVKHDNFLLGGLQDQTVKLCDFGLTTMLQDKENLAKQCGSAAYMAPEVLTPHGKCGTASDVWSLGVIIYVSFFGQWPYRPKENTRRAMCTAIRLGAELPPFRPSPSFDQGAVSNVAISFVRAMLNRSPNARCSAETCLQMSYLLRARIQTTATDDSGLSAVSLKPVLKAAINRGVLVEFDPAKQSHIVSLLVQQQDKHLSVENASHDDKLKTAQRAQVMNESQDMPLPGEESGFDNDMPNFVGTVQ